MNIFDTVQMPAPKHSAFDLSHDLKLSMRMGFLVPVMTMETLPGDRVTITQEALFRMMPLISPVMHNINVYFHTFFVPNRILWDNWEKFITGGEYGSTPPALPTISFGQCAPSSLMDYLGCPVSTTSKVANINALPFAAYQRIWYDYYRSEDLQPGEPLMLVDGAQAAPDETELKDLKVRGWEHDYFTAALPFAQKGAPVELPIDFTNAEIVAVGPLTTATGFNPVWRDSTTDAAVVGNGGTSSPFNKVHNVNNVGSAGFSNSGNTDFQGAYYDPLGTLELDGTAGTTINDLRAAVQLQLWLEANARGGTRYVESLLVHFNVRSSDARLNRAEYIGGSKGAMAISEVLQTSSSDATSPQANMAGHGISVNGGGSGSYRCEEHGHIITICSILPRTAYYSGLPRFLFKQDRFDFAWPLFAELGEQPIYNREVVFRGNAAMTDDIVWGYIPRYSEYKYMPSRVAGELTTTLEFWQMGRKFSDAVPPPPLNEDFIKSDPTGRIFAVDDPDEDHIVGHVFNKIFAVRPLPKYGTPGAFLNG